MKNYLSFLRRFYFKVINSIALYPSVISCIFLLLAVFMMYIEYHNVVTGLKENISFLLIEDKDMAKSVLTTLVAGLISLTVFSFSMVMVVLNTASSNLSPRVVPGLVSKKAHQFVLGFYLGSIIYCFLLIINIQKAEDSYRVPSLGILLSILLAIACLILFVYFINSISQTIQTDNVLNKIFRETEKMLHRLKAKFKNKGDQVQLPDVSTWVYIRAGKSGYYKDLAEKKLSRILNENDLKAYVRITKGFFVVKGFPILNINKDISDDKDLVNSILGCFTFFIEEYTKDHYSYGFRQISEIGVKALSPGINDPGTAVRAVDMLSILFTHKTGIPDFDFREEDNDDILLFHTEYSFEQLLLEMLVPIRQYGHADPLLIVNLIEACKNMLYAEDISEKEEKAIVRFLKSIVEDADKHIQNTLDKEGISNALKNLPEKARVLLKV